MISRSARIAVIGAGAFGGWTALELLRRGARVTLIDAWGPGNVRSSSGGATRVIRAIYGTRGVYTRMAARALELWRAHEKRFQRGFYRQTGVLWMFGADDSFGATSAEMLRAQNIPLEEPSVAAAQRRYPQINFDGITSLLLEPEAGHLLARRACQHVVECFVAEGGAYRVAAAPSPVPLEALRSRRLPLGDGSVIEVDAFVFACGPWLGALFPEAIGPRITATRQEAYYFGTPAGDVRFLEGRMPAWIEVGPRVLYGVPGDPHGGFKFADDTPGPPFDPTSGDRSATPSGVAGARRFLARRFPALADAPLLHAEVCQYEATPDAHFLIDRHPRVPDVWIAGGGSGHGFKMGPAIGELMASLILDDRDPPSEFRVARFAGAHPDSQLKWT